MEELEKENLKLLDYIRELKSHQRKSLMIRDENQQIKDMTIQNEVLKFKGIVLKLENKVCPNFYISFKIDLNLKFLIVDRPQKGEHLAENSA